MVTRSKHADKGKWAESEVKQYMDQLSARNKLFAYHRLPDARAARGALEAQPADFYAVYHGTFLHIEVKETANPRRLPRDKISQYSKLKMFHWAGAHCLVIVYRSLTQDWTYFVGADLFEYAEPPASFPFMEGRSFPTAAAVFNHHHLV